MKRSLCLSIVLFAAVISCVSAGIREDADRCFRTAQVLIARSNDYAAGDEKNKCMQKAVKLLDHALELYDRYIEKNPAAAAELEDRITEINAQRFWCNRLTTMTFNKSSLPPVEKILEEEGVDLSGEEEGEEDTAPPRPKLEEIMAASKKPLTKEEAQKIAIETMKRQFLDRIQVLVAKRLLANARIQCKRMLRYKDTGIPPEFYKQIIDEIDFIEVFFTSVFDNAMQMKGKKLTLAKTIHNVTIEGVVTKFDKGMLHVNMEGKGIEMGIPLFNFNDGFLVRNVSSRDKNVIAGIGAFFLLEGKMDYAKNTFTKLAGMEGEPSDISPFVRHMRQITAIRETEHKEKEDTAALDYSVKQFKTALSKYKRKDYDLALRYILKMYDKSGENMEILLKISNISFEETEKYLPELVKELVEGCPACNGTRKVPCRSCGGKGRYKVRGKWNWCPTCKGEAEMECPECKKRMADKKNIKLLEDMRRLFKRDEDVEEGGGEGEQKAVPNPEKKKVGDRIPL